LVDSSPPFEIPSTTVLETITLPFPETTWHKKTAIRQSALQEGVENGLKITAHEPGNPYTRADKGGLINV